MVACACMLCMCLCVLFVFDCVMVYGLSFCLCVVVCACFVVCVLFVMCGAGLFGVLLWFV